MATKQTTSNQVSGNSSDAGDVSNTGGSFSANKKSKKKGCLIGILGCLGAIIILLLVIVFIFMYVKKKAKEELRKQGISISEISENLKELEETGSKISSGMGTTIPDGSGQNSNTPSSTTAKQVAGIPIYPGAQMINFVDENGQQSANYRTDVGVTSKMIFDYYAQTLPALGWGKVASDTDRSVTYQNKNGEKALIWIFYENPGEGVDYVVESPPIGMPIQ